MKRYPASIALFLALMLALLGCADKGREAKVYSYEIVGEYPHNPESFTQGLAYHEGFLYESTGLYGKSKLIRLDLESGKVLSEISLDDEYFGEGLTILGGKLIQLTWQEKKGFVYDRDSFEILEEFSYPSEGWGLATDGKSLIMSDGTPKLRFINPETFQEERAVAVTKNGVPLGSINELEFIKGKIYANVWQTRDIVIIDPETGRVEAEASMESLNIGGDAMNGIAYDPEKDRIFITGKMWPKIFEIKLAP